MPLLNNTLSGLSGGVSQQYQEGRFDSQVSEMVNCIPTLARGVLRRNPLSLVGTLSGAISQDSFTYTYDRGTGDEQYLIVIDGTGKLEVYNINTATLLYTKLGDDYLVSPVDTIPRDVFSALTVGDHTFITNSTISTAMDTTSALAQDIVDAATVGYEGMAFYWIKKTTSTILEQKQTGTDPVLSGSKMRGYDYTLNNIKVEGLSDNRPGEPIVDLNTAYTIAAKFASLGTAGVSSSLEGVSYTTSIQASFSEWEWSDTFGNEASIGVYKTVPHSDKLPSQLPAALDGFAVKVSGGTSAEFDDYYLKYDHTNRTWTEVIKPGEYSLLDAVTMPHVLYRLSTGFLFDEYKTVATDGVSLLSTSEWGSQVAGDADPLNRPSFLGKGLSNIFFFKNRLGFLTDDSIILSQTGAYGHFFVQTMQSVLDDDPIDLAIASRDVSILRTAVPTAGQLLIFSDDTQFSLGSAQGPLTPSTATITALSNYTYSPKAEAKTIGNKIYFLNEAGNYSQVYSYRATEQGVNTTEANQMTIHLPTYIESDMTRIIGHDVLGNVFFYGAVANEIKVLNTIVKGGEDLQNAFSTWTLPEDIVDSNVINNTLYLVFASGALGKMSLEIPKEITSIVYEDVLSTTTQYDSYLEFSEFFIRDERGRGTTRGRHQLRTLKYTITEDSNYSTEISNTDRIVSDPTIIYGPIWEDTDTWDDLLIWADVDPVYSRVYTNNELITVMADSKKVEIKFGQVDNKGFELATVNIEAFFHQRSQRVR